ncbi:MAG: glycosyltransferase [Methanomicrobiaceae archaeon]|nr:glycosyltransferase [Methanomicrobiaceae archaeon]
MLFSAGFTLLVIGMLPYLVFLAGILAGKQPDAVPAPSSYPPISIIIPAYNEEAVIGERIRNIALMAYPGGCEVILVDDRSTDRTGEVAKACFRELGIPHTVLVNEGRMGTNRSFNHGISHAAHETIVTTGADVYFAPGALEVVVGRLMSDPAIGAVCADMLPREGGPTTGSIERTYRSIYGRMCAWESAHDSTYNFNGGLVVFRRGVVEKIRERKGADDANTAFEAIRKGYRAFYEIRAVVYEDVPDELSRQSGQKIRRAGRLIEATLANLDLLHTPRPFSRIFYPLRIAMFVLSPPLIWAGLVLAFGGIALVAPVPAMCAVLVLGLLLVVKPDSLISAFLFNQWYLINGLVRLGRDKRVWESTSRKSA